MIYYYLSYLTYFIELYRIVSTCYNNELMEYCPIQIEIIDEGLQE